MTQCYVHLVAKRKNKDKAKTSVQPHEVRFRPLHGALAELRDRLEQSPSLREPASATHAKNKAPSVTSKAASKTTDRRTYDERMALQQAYQGVKPLGAGGPRKRALAEAATEAIPALVPSDEFRSVQRMVAEGVRFVVDEDELGNVSAHRASRGKQALAALKKGNADPEASVDLHGFREEPARQMLQRWVRAEQRRGRRIVRVIHGQGLHSAGAAVLREAVRDELESGLCAAYVDAFLTASARQGGQGALLVALRSR